MGVLSEGSFLFDSDRTAELKNSLSQVFAELYSVTANDSDKSETPSGLSGTSVAQACTDATSAVGNVSFRLGLSMVTLGTKVNTVIEELSALDMKRTQDTENLAEELG
ncbi:hypothetical protein [Nocardia sp. NPDC004415]